MWWGRGGETGELAWEQEVDFQERGGLSTFTGRAWVVGEVLLMSSWKVLGESRFRDMAEAVEAANALPVWDRTPYFLKLADIGHSGLLDCKTFQPVSEEIRERLMPALGFKRVGGAA
jgi:hypothetical protein